jgi:hypothetical protein
MALATFPLMAFHPPLYPSSRSFSLAGNTIHVNLLPKKLDIPSYLLAITLSLFYKLSAWINSILFFDDPGSLKPN